jgi:hypothetical protein
VLKSKIRHILVFTFAMVVAACGSSGDTGNKSATSSPKFFKAQDGAGSEYFPMVGIREYDNQITSYAFWRNCDYKASGVLSIHTGSNTKPVPNNALYGPQAESASCRLSAKLVYANGILNITGEFNAASININMQEISRSQFVEMLKDDKLGFRKSYQNLPVFEQSSYDQICMDLFGLKCPQIF